VQYCLAAQHIPAPLVAQCNDILVKQEGFASGQILGRVCSAVFNREYLRGLGITGAGIQQVLIDLHALNRAKVCADGVWDRVALTKNVWPPLTGAPAPPQTAPAVSPFYRKLLIGAAMVLIAYVAPAYDVVTGVACAVVFLLVG